MFFPGLEMPTGHLGLQTTFAAASLMLQHRSRPIKGATLYGQPAFRLYE
jgi:hypothetical protein